MKPIKYYTKKHPLYRDEIEIKFHFNGLPYVKVDDITQTFSINKFFEWLELKYISDIIIKKITLKHITDVVCDFEQVNKDIVFSKTRIRKIVQTRQIIHSLARELTNESLSYIGQYTGKDHATILYSKKTIAGYIDSYPEWRKKIFDIKEQLL